MKLVSIASRLNALRGRRGFRADARGVAAIEFAMILPLMLALYMGVLELSMGYQASRKVSLFARTVADITSQADTAGSTSTARVMSAADMSNLRNSANWILAPFPIAAGQVRMTVSSVSVEGATLAAVNWSIGYEGVRRACGPQTIVPSSNAPSLTTVPAGVAQANTSIIIADIEYDYKPLLGGSFKSFGGGALSQLTLKQTSYMRPRHGLYVELQSGVVDANYCPTAWHP